MCLSLWNKETMQATTVTYITNAASPRVRTEDERLSITAAAPSVSPNALPPRRRKATTTKHAPGPTSRTDRLTRLDRRTTIGRVLRDTAAQLVADIGGDPSAAERLLIQNAAVKATKLHLLPIPEAGPGPAQVHVQTTIKSHDS